MVKGIATVLTTLACCLQATVCFAGELHGVLVGRFSDQEALLKAKIDLPTSGEPAELHYAVRQGPLSYWLTARLAESEIQPPYDCAGRRGSGEIRCNDGRKLPLSWSLSSCRGGFGRSPERNTPVFFFGFGIDTDRALDRLEESVIAEIDERYSDASR